MAGDVHSAVSATPLVRRSTGKARPPPFVAPGVTLVSKKVPKAWGKYKCSVPNVGITLMFSAGK